MLEIKCGCFILITRTHMHKDLCKSTVCLWNHKGKQWFSLTCCCCSWLYCPSKYTPTYQMFIICDEKFHFKKIVLFSYQWYITLFSFQQIFIGLPSLQKINKMKIKWCLPVMKVTSLSMIQRNAKYKCTWTYRPMRWCNLIVTSRACSITVSGMYEKCTGSPVKYWPPILKNTLAWTNTCT